MLDADVLRLTDAHGTGRASLLDRGVYELLDGRIVRFKAYLDRAEALQAAGLRD